MVAKVLSMVVDIVSKLQKVVKTQKLTFKFELLTSM